MKKIIYTLIIVLVAVASWVFGKGEIEKKTAAAKPLTAAEKTAGRKKWEASPDGVLFKKWEASPAGQKVLAGIDKIRKPVKDFTPMEAVVTSLTLPPGSRLGYGIMVQIQNDTYILSFGGLKPTEYQSLKSLKVNDKILIKSRNVSYAPKYAYPIIAGDFIEKNGQLIYQRKPTQDGC